MKSVYALPLAAALSLAFLGACSKPAAPAATDAGPAPVADSASPSAGGAVSPPAANGAVNTDANTNATDVTPASSSFTESQARGHIENAGYANVSGLTKTPDGLWVGKATKDGKTVDVGVDFKGAVTAR